MIDHYDLQIADIGVEQEDKWPVMLTSVKSTDLVYNQSFEITQAVISA